MNKGLWKCQKQHLRCDSSKSFGTLLTSLNAVTLRILYIVEDIIILFYILLYILLWVISSFWFLLRFLKKLFSSTFFMIHFMLGLGEYAWSLFYIRLSIYSHILVLLTKGYRFFRNCKCDVTHNKSFGSVFAAISEVRKHVVYMTYNIIFFFYGFLYDIVYDV